MNPSGWAITIVVFVPLCGVLLVSSAELLDLVLRVGELRFERCVARVCCV